MRYESWAYGTRDEIGRELTKNLGAQRSKRRQAEAAQAINELQTNAAAVHFGHTTYVVTGEPHPYLVELTLDDRAEVDYERVNARSNTEAWKLAHELAQGKGRVTRLYRDVTQDEI